MGTNFYWIKGALNKTKFKDWMEIKKQQDEKYFAKKQYAFMINEDEEYFYHIGRRSAAGYFCPDCNLTSNEGGNAGVHYMEYEHTENCPLCGKNLSNSYTCSFNWYDFDRDQFLLGKLKATKRKLIKDEYGDEYTVKEFYEEISNCRINRFHHEWFA